MEKRHNECTNKHTECKMQTVFISLFKIGNQNTVQSWMWRLWMCYGNWNGFISFVIVIWRFSRATIEIQQKLRRKVSSYEMPSVFFFFVSIDFDFPISKLWIVIEFSTDVKPNELQMNIPFIHFFCTALKFACYDCMGMRVHWKYVFKTSNI